MARGRAGTVAACLPATDAGDIMLLVRAQAYVLSHMRGPLSVADMATWCGTDEPGLCAAVRAGTGQRPQDFVTNVRLDAARELLLSNRELRCQAALAAALGFTRVKTFQHAYQRRFVETRRRMALQPVFGVRADADGAFDRTQSSDHENI